MKIHPKLHFTDYTVKRVVCFSSDHTFVTLQKLMWFDTQPSRMKLPFNLFSYLYILHCLVHGRTSTYTLHTHILYIPKQLFSPKMTPFVVIDSPSCKRRHCYIRNDYYSANEWQDNNSMIKSGFKVKEDFGSTHTMSIWS